jgi:hypothetical protein
MLTDAELDAMQRRCDMATAELTEEYAIKHLGFQWWSWIGTPVKGTPGYPNKMRVRQLLSPRQRKLPSWKSKLKDPQYEARPADGTEPLDYTYCSSGCSVEWPPQRKVSAFDVAETDLPRLIAAYRELRRLLTCCRVEDGDREDLSTDGVLALLSAYWVDALPDHRDAFDDAYYAAWESWARPLVDWLVTERRKAAAERDELRRQLDTAIRDQCDDDTAIRAAAKTLLPAEWVDGDSEYVPPVVEIVGRLATELADLKDRVANGAE